MTWITGQSGNPKGGGGYGRHAVKFAEAMRAGPVQEAVRALEECVQQTEDRQVRLAAAKEILARGIGKPPDAVITLADFSDDELWTEMERRLQANNKPTSSEKAQQQ